MATTTARTRGSNPMDTATMLRPPNKALRYGLVRRMSDAFAGHRDGRVDLLAIRTVADGPDEAADISAQRSSSLDDGVAASRRWLARNEETYAERDHREFLEAQAAVALRRSRLSVLDIAIDTATAEEKRSRDNRATLSEAPAADALARRGPAEGADSPAVIEMRRRAEHTRTLASADAAIAQARMGTGVLLEERAELITSLQAAFEAQVTRSERLRSFHSRRAMTYLRGFRRVIIRNHPDPASLRLPVATIPAPEWTLGPCPWTPRTDQLTLLRQI